MLWAVGIILIFFLEKWEVFWSSPKSKILKWSHAFAWWHQTFLNKLDVFCISSCACFHLQKDVFNHLPILESTKAMIKFQIFYGSLQYILHSLYDIKLNVLNIAALAYNA
jgi:hypothetical protein